jgi:hypothetical protein
MKRPAAAAPAASAPASAPVAPAAGPMNAANDAPDVDAAQDPQAESLKA